MDSTAQLRNRLDCEPTLHLSRSHVVARMLNLLKHRLAGLLSRWASWIDPEGVAALTSTTADGAPISLHVQVHRDLSLFMREAGLPCSDEIAYSLMGVLDRIPDYTEEGARLYPELVLTTNIDDVLKPLPLRRRARIGSGAVPAAFRGALKHCAPLASAGWTIYIEMHSAEEASYGVAAVGITEISPSLYDHVAGSLASPKEESTPAVYIRARNAQNVELATVGTRLTILLGLGDVSEQTDVDALSRFAYQVTANVPDDRRTIAQAFIQRLLEEATRATHGCMLAVAPSDDVSQRRLREGLHDGVYLGEPIDVMDLLRELDEARTREASTVLRSSMELVKGMVSQDGIAVFSSDGKVLGFNVFMHQQNKAKTPGGARRRAFDALCASGFVISAIAMSHDGGISYWEQTQRTDKQGADK